MGTSLDDALNGKVAEDTNAPEPETEAVEVQDAPEAVEVKQEAAQADEQPETEKPDTGQPRDKTGKFAKKDKASEAPDNENGENGWTYHAYKDEKDKRQALEAKVAEMEARQRNQPQPQPQAPDPIDDPQAYNAYVRQEVEQQVLNARLDMSEAMARQAHGDEAVEAALEAAKALQDKAVAQKIMHAPNPYGELMKWHQREQVMSEIGEDPQAYRQRIEAEIRAELEQQQPAPATPSTPKPSNFATARNAGTRKGPSWGGPTSLDSALGQVRN